VLQAIQSGGSVPITRVAGLDPLAIGKVLDLGSLGVIVPMVESAAEAARAAAACRYPPAGSRSVGAMRPGPVMGSDDVDDWAQVACVVMVETVRGLEDVEAIAATPGVDAIYVGPGDLGISMGMSAYPARRSPEEAERHRAALERVRVACDRAGIACGLFVGEGAAAKGYLDQGFRLVTASIDFTLIEAGSRRDLAIARGELAG
jgi:4-hydroxy-2-oxoheptanedioate aldolase